MIKQLSLLLLFAIGLIQTDTTPATAQSVLPTTPDQLRGSITPERAWWDLKHYELELEVFPETKSIAGSNTIRFMPIGQAAVEGFPELSEVETPAETPDGDSFRREPQPPGKPSTAARLRTDPQQKNISQQRRMQIDLQQPLKITKVLHNDLELKFARNDEATGNVYWIDFEKRLPFGNEQTIQIFYSGVPQEASNPPWDGGFSWKTDEQGNSFIATSRQGAGASIRFMKTVTNWSSCPISAWSTKAV